MLNKTLEVTLAKGIIVPLDITTFQMKYLQLQQKQYYDEERQGIRVHIQHSRDHSVWCQNVDREISLLGRFSYSIRSAIQLCPQGSCAAPDL